MARTIGLVMVMLLLFAAQAMALEVEGVSIPPTAEVAGAKLALNGAGVRKKFFIKVYVAALYLSHATTSADEALKGPARLTQTFVYSHVEAAKIKEAWHEGFAANLSKDELAAVQARLERFSAMFGDAYKGDAYAFEFIPGKGVAVSLKGAAPVVIEGDDFARGLLKVWLGSSPVDSGLKRALLGEKS